MIHKERLVDLDMMRVILVVFVFLFHSRMHAANYGLLNPIVSKGFIFMTAFFMLSGFCLYYTQEEILTNWSAVKNFYKRRILSVMPAYWAIAVIHPIQNKCLNLGGGRAAVVLFPIELLGLQSAFHSVSNISHNGGTWFVSCLLLCYVIFPLIHMAVRSMTTGNIRMFMVIAIGVLLYSPLIVKYFGIEDLYANSFFRILEFGLGMLLAAIWEQIKDTKFYARWMGNYIIYIDSLYYASSFRQVSNGIYILFYV